MERKSLHTQAQQQASASLPFFQKKGCNCEQEEVQAAPALQTQLTVSQPGDPYELEADRMADQVVNQSAQNTEVLPLYRQISPLSPMMKQAQRVPDEEYRGAEEGPEVQMVPSQLSVQQQTSVASQPRAMINSRFTDTSYAQSLSQRLIQSQGKGASLLNFTQKQMEGSFGVDFGQVKIHTDNEAVQMNQELMARAFTTGSDIYFNQGEYQPHTSGGQHLLAHELTHVVQQGGINRSIQEKPYIQRADQENESNIYADAWESITDYFEGEEDEVMSENGYEEGNVSGYNFEENTSIPEDYNEPYGPPESSIEYSTTEQNLDPSPVNTDKINTFYDPTTLSDGELTDEFNLVNQVIDSETDDILLEELHAYRAALSNERYSRDYDKRFGPVSDDSDQTESPASSDLILTQNEINSAVKFNRKYLNDDSAESWSKYYDRIVDEILLLNYSPSEEDFAVEVAFWQSENSFSSDYVDGKLGMGTWSKMKLELVDPNQIIMDIDRRLLEGNQILKSVKREKFFEESDKLKNDFDETSSTYDILGLEKKISAEHEKTEKEWNIITKVIKKENEFSKNHEHPNIVHLGKLIKENYDKRKTKVDLIVKFEVLNYDDIRPLTIFLAYSMGQKNEYLNQTDPTLIDFLLDEAIDVAKGLAGECIKEQSTGGLVLDTIIGFVPIAGQVADVRDVICHVYFMSTDPKERKSVSRWVGLLFTLIGFIPGVGDIIKNLYKGTKKGIAKIGGALIEKIKKIFPNNPEDYLRKLHDEVSESWDSLIKGAENRLISITKTIARLYYKANGFFSSIPGKIRTAAIKAKEKINHILFELRRLGGEDIAKRVPEDEIIKHAEKTIPIGDGHNINFTKGGKAFLCSELCTDITEFTEMYPNILSDKKIQNELARIASKNPEEIVSDLKRLEESAKAIILQSREPGLREVKDFMESLKKGAGKEEKRVKVVALLKFDGEVIYGTNQKVPSTDVFDNLSAHKYHAEIDTLGQTVDLSSEISGKDVIMWVTDNPCKACITKHSRGNLNKATEQVGFNSMVIHTPTQTIVLNSKGIVVKVIPI